VNGGEGPRTVSTLAIILLIGLFTLMVVAFRVFYGAFPGMAPGGR